MVFEHAEMSGRHGEAIVKAPFAAARDVNERAVEDRSESRLSPLDRK